MAQTIAIISGSPLIGSPIVYRVTPASYDADRTFHRIMVRVYAALETDADYTTFDFSTPVEVKPSGASYATQPSDFDISSALQAVADKYGVEPCPVGSDWQYNQIYSDPMAWVTRGTIDFLRGGLVQRHTGDGDGRRVVEFSRLKLNISVCVTLNSYIKSKLVICIRP